MIEAPLTGARAVFTTRTGGQSAGPYASRNLGIFTDDDTQTVRENISRLAEGFGLTGMQLLRQVHGAELHEFGAHSLAETPIADGGYTSEREIPILITGADCPTVFLSDGERLAAIHCGWRPVADGIVEAGGELFKDGFEAVIGPGICRDHFEVGPEVIEAMGRDGELHSSGRQLDLTGVIRARLERCGAGSVHVVERCTFCEPDVFFSHRRDGGVTGRQAGVAWLV